MDRIKKLLAAVKGLWSKSTMLQRSILAGIVIVVIAGIGALVSVSSSPVPVNLFSTPVRDEAARDRIVTRLDQEGVRATVTATGIIQVDDQRTARRMRALIDRERLLPAEDPWAIADVERWTLTDFERNVNRQRAIERQLTDRISRFEGVANAELMIVLPKDSLFTSLQNPVSVSLSITPRPGSDITENRKKIEGIQSYIKSAIEGLRDENIIITDHQGFLINDFEGMAEFDRITNIARQQKELQKLEENLRKKILTSLQSTFGNDRVRELDVRIEMDMSEVTVASEEVSPIMMRERTPGLAYDDSIRVESIPRSVEESRTSWEGIGHFPEGPPGVEGQVPPVYGDTNNVFGKVNQETLRQNNELNKRTTQEIRSPQMGRRTVSVNIDGTWQKRFNEKREPVIGENNSIERIYTPVPDSLLREVDDLIRGAIGFSAARQDSVTVRNIQFDRTFQFAEEDAAFFKQKQFEFTITIFLIGVAVLLVGLIVVRAITRAIERKKRLEAEERARREELLRQQALLQAEEEGMDVSISVEERSRLELQEAVANMTKEHPEDAAQLIRTWLSED